VIGCPLTAQGPTPDGKGTYVPFELGWIVEPNNGSLGTDFLLVAHFYTYGPPRILVDFGPSDPFHYDKWLVRWDIYGGANVGQVDTPGGNSGRYSIENLDRSKTYTVYVEGCDNGDFGSNCRQGWSPAAVLQIGHVNGATVPPPSPPHANPVIIAKLLGSGTATILDVSGKNFKPGAIIQVYVTSQTAGQVSTQGTPLIATQQGLFPEAQFAMPCASGLGVDVHAVGGNEYSNHVLLTCQ